MPGMRPVEAYTKIMDEVVTPRFDRDSRTPDRLKAAELVMQAIPAGEMAHILIAALDVIAEDRGYLPVDI